MLDGIIFGLDGLSKGPSSRELPQLKSRAILTIHWLSQTVALRLLGRDLLSRAFVLLISLSGLFVIRCLCLFVFQVQLLVSEQDVENYKQIKTDLDQLRLTVEKSELWVEKSGVYSSEDLVVRQGKEQNMEVLHNRSMISNI